MAGNTQIPFRSPHISRPNPFLFPSDTDLRFVLLIFSVLGSTLFVYNIFSADLLSPQIRAALQCMRPIESSTLSDIEIVYQHNMLCQAVYLRSLVVWLCCAICLLLIVAFILYWLFPAWKIWRGKLEPISVEDAPDVVEYLEELRHEAGLAIAPLFVWNPLNQASSALAFGHFRRYYVFLSGGLVTQFYTDKAAFRAIVLHELAHLHNADVNKTYFTITIWYAFVLIALVPFVVYMSVGLPLGILPTLNVLWRLLALIALVYLTRNAVLRSREFYADVRASMWNNVSDALSRILNASLPVKERFHIQRYWNKLMSFHPDPRERYQMLGDTRPLFHRGFWEAFGVGIATGVAVPNVQALLEWLFYSWQVDFRIVIMPYLLVTALIFTPLIIGTVGLNVWRSAFAASVQQEALRGVGRLGLCLGLGIILGLFLSLPNFLENAPMAAPAQVTACNLIWSALLLVSMFGFFKWVASGASNWLTLTTRRSSLRAIYWRGLAFAGLVLFGLGTQFLQFNTITTQLLPYLGLLIITVVKDLFVDMLLQPITLLITIVLWAFPLATWFWRDKSVEATNISWATTNMSLWQIPLLHRNGQRPGLAFMIGLLGGFVFSLLLLIIRIVVHVSPLALLINNNIEYADIYYYSQVGLAVILQTGSAVLVSIIVKRQSISHGLLAAFVGGCVMIGCLFALNLFFGGTIDPEITWLSTGLILNGGSLLAIVASTAAVWISRQIITESVAQTA